MKTQKSRKQFLQLFLLIIFALCFFSCTKSINETAFISKLDIIDVTISAGQYDSAIKMLNKLSSDSLGSFQRLGIVKRYLKLGETQLAENLLKKSIKKLSDNVELNAVYSHFLLNQNRLDEAENYAKKLVGTNFASIYSEVMFRKTLKNEDYYSSDYIQLYLDAAKSTGESVWLRNAAIISARNGDLSSALSFKPTKLNPKDLPVFWALLEYDSERFVESLETLTQSQNSSEVVLLKSNNLLKLNEITSAYDLWTSEIQNSKNQIPFEIYYNASKFALSESDYNSTYEYLISMVEKYPYSEKALALYGDFAFLMDSLKNQPQKSLVKTSLKTLKNEQIDLYPRIPISDVLYKMNFALDEKFSSPLLVEYLQAKWEAEKYSEEKKQIDIWNTLENTMVNNVYDDYVVNFAISYFSLHHKEEQAENLFAEYIFQKYGNNNLENLADVLTDWEAETGAWYSIKNDDFNTAVKLYENLCFERYEKPSLYVQLNLGAVYDAMGEEKKAMDVYSQLASKNLGNVLTSEVHYRIGSIQYNLKDRKNALLSLNYSVKLNPNNHKARLLLKKIN